MIGLGGCREALPKNERLGPLVFRRVVCAFPRRCQSQHCKTRPPLHDSLDGRRPRFAPSRTSRTASARFAAVPSISSIEQASDVLSFARPGRLWLLLCLFRRSRHRSPSSGSGSLCFHNFLPRRPVRKLHHPVRRWLPSFRPPSHPHHPPSQWHSHCYLSPSRRLEFHNPDGCRNHLPPLPRKHPVYRLPRRRQRPRCGCRVRRPRHQPLRLCGHLMFADQLRPVRAAVRSQRLSFPV